jgi:ribulose-5-phosphate 4-epimerase/fuculose-1-phosphate aldolase
MIVNIRTVEIMKKKNRDLYWSIMKEICAIAKKMADFGLVIGSAGNVSARIPEKEEFFITPSQIEYETLQPYQIVHLNFEGKQLEGDWTPSSERNMHFEIYKNREDINAIIHTHSRYASILSIIGKGIPPLMEEMINVIGGGVSISKFSQVGTKELGLYALDVLEDKKGVLLQNHGALACGKDLNEALGIARIIEENAEIYFNILLLGEQNIVELPESAIKFQRLVFEAFNKKRKKKPK